MRQKEEILVFGLHTCPSKFSNSERLRTRLYLPSLGRLLCLDGA